MTTFTKSCVICGKEFQSIKRTQKYCSYACNNRSRSEELWFYLFSRIHRDANDCWLWDGRLSPSGYGDMANTKYRRQPVHRLVYELLVGPIPDGQFACHRCDVRNCCNPAHIFLGTAKENQADMAAKGRSTIGERHPGAKLDVLGVRLIQQLHQDGMPQSNIAKMFKISRSIISRILSGKLWARALEQ